MWRNTCVGLAEIAMATSGQERTKRLTKESLSHRLLAVDGVEAPSQWSDYECDEGWFISSPVIYFGYE